MLNSRFIWRSTQLFVLITLIISLALNIILYRQGRAYYLDLNGTRLDPLGIGYYPSNSKNPLQSGTKRRVVFFGDSRAAQWETPQNVGDFEFLNRGIGALQLGINDLKTIPLFPAQEAKIIANCKENIRQIVEKSTRSGASVLVTTIFPLGQLPIERRPFWSNDVAIAIADVNQFIVSLQREHVKVFNTAEILTDQTTHSETIDPAYSKDFLHLNSQGYTALNEEITEILKQFE